MEFFLNNELQKLLEEYGRAKQADDKFILQAFDIILSSKNITDKVKNINVGKDAYLFKEPYYEEENKTIYMKSNIPDVEDYFTIKGDIIKAYNLKVLYEILTLCNKLSECDYINGFVRNLLYLSSIYNYPGLKPDERMAQIKASKEILTLAYASSFANKKLATNYFKYQTLLNLLKGYTKYTSPTLDFCLKCNELTLANASCYGKTEQEIHNYLQNESTKNSLDTNLYIGLPILPSQYEEVTKLKEDTHSKLQRTKSLFF